MNISRRILLWYKYLTKLKNISRSWQVSHEVENISRSWKISHEVDKCLTKLKNISRSWKISHEVALHGRKLCWWGRCSSPPRSPLDPPFQDLGSNWLLPSATTHYWEIIFRQIQEIWECIVENDLDHDFLLIIDLRRLVGRLVVPHSEARDLGRQGHHPSSWYFVVIL